MVDTENGNRTTHGPSASADALLELASVLRNMCVAGSFAVENILSEGDFRGVAERFAPFLDPMQRTDSTFQDVAEAGVGASAKEDMPQGGATDKAADMASVVAQAYLIAMVSGLRYWRRVAETYRTHESAIVRSLMARAAVPSRSDAERRALIDEIRAYLREVGDISVQEARIVQTDLDKLAAEVAKVASNCDESTHRRRWKTKP
jgi:hypothetical protein